MGMTVGIDLVSIEAIEDSIRVHSERYLGRVYTTVELDDCRLPDGGYDARRLAGRVAAKEAVLKVLRVGDEAIPWRAIGVRRNGRGRPSVELTGAAQELARERGIESMQLSITQAGAFAAAVVVAEVCGER
ncbi:MAG TPA: holo-ACP synthase [Solirubrobacteraceae bacterium]|nr:holo-ACP synthase [Solirubrobacteraceae bacterium]